MEDSTRISFMEAGVDVDDCLNRFLNKDELFFRFMKKYLEDNNVEKLGEALECGDVSEAFKVAHALKGVAGNLSFAAILDPLVPFVEVLRAGSMEGADNVYAQIKEAHQRIVAQIKTLN